MIQLPNENFRIEIADEQSHPFDHQRLVSAVELILTDYGIQIAEISIAIVDDPAIRELNRTYLNHDYETDVISFLLDYAPDREFLAGQLIVSTDTAARVALELGIPLDHELLLYVVHGTLHLVGLDDTAPELAQEMRTAEQEYLTQLGVDYHWPDAGEST